jgi:rare lipoprotein A
MTRTPSSSPTALGLACAVVALLAGCAGRPVQRDGPPDKPPAQLLQTPDAVPRVEPLRAGGPNKPYEAFGQRYVPHTADVPLDDSGGASWYGRKFHGLPTSSGEAYDMYAMTAAHRTMPIPSYARVRNPANGREVIVRINDRGPFADGRVIDLSYVAAVKLGLLAGVAPVQVHRLTHREIRSLQGAAAAPGLPRITRPDLPADLQPEP